jgi:hypothetical protein
MWDRISFFLWALIIDGSTFGWGLWNLLDDRRSIGWALLSFGAALLPLGFDSRIRSVND